MSPYIYMHCHTRWKWKKWLLIKLIFCYIILTKHQIWRNTSHSWTIPLASSEREPYSVHFSCNNQFCKNLAKIYTYIHLYINTLNVDIHVANSQQTLSLHHGCFMLGLEEIGPVVLEKKIFKFRQYIFYIPLWSTLGKGYSPLFEQTCVSFTQLQGCFVLCLVETGPVVLEKKIFEFNQCMFTISLLSPL